jgi:catechol 2,3-dioxygenase
MISQWLTRAERVLGDQMQLRDVTLAVRDLERSIALYTSAVGLRLMQTDGDTASLGAGTAALRLVERPDGAARGDRAGLFHVAWLLADRAHLGVALSRLARAGVRLTGAADHHFSEAVYLDDPDGHGIELYADRPPEQWHADGALALKNSRLDLGELQRAGEAAGLEPEQSAEDARLGHVHLEAVDLAASSGFSRERLGLELQAAWPNAHFLGWRGYHHHLAYNDWHRRSRRLLRTDAHTGLIGIGIESALGQAPAAHEDPNGIVFSIS